MTERYTIPQEITHEVGELEDIEVLGLIGEELRLVTETPIQSEDYQQYVLEQLGSIQKVIALQAELKPIPLVYTRDNHRRLDLGILTKS